MMERSYYENVIDEITEIIKTNILLYYRNDDETFLELKNYCQNKNDNNYQKLDYWNLIFLVEEALAELINCDYLYDFRALE